MKIKYAALFLCEILSASQLHSSGRFYIGISLQGTLRHSKVSLDDDYWGAVVEGVYKDSFMREGEAVVDVMKNLIQKGTPVTNEGKTTIAPFYASAALPADLLRDALYKQKAECYDSHPFAAGGMMTMGVFCLRSQNVLAAVELTGGRIFLEEKNPGRFSVISAQFPFALDDDIFQSPEKYSEEGISYKTSSEGGIVITVQPTAAVNAQLNPNKMSQAPLSYLQSPKLEGRALLEMKETFSARLILRAGTVLNDRVYLCVLLGGEATRLRFKFKQILDREFNDMYYCYINSTFVSANTTINFQCNALPPEEGATPNNTKLICDRAVTRLAIVGGVGAEFFLNRRLSARFDLTVAFGPDTLIQTDRMAKLRYSELRGQAGLGMVWRF